MRRRLTTLGALMVLGIAALTGPAWAERTSAARVFRGRATVTLESYEPCGTGGGFRLAGRTTYQAAAQFGTGPRKSYGGFAERNPFTWLFYVGAIGATGSFQLGSAAVANPPGVLLGYWSSTYDRGSGRFDGRLIATHTDKATAYNSFFGRQDLIACRPSLGQIPMVSALGVGSRITGVIAGGHARLTLTGRTADARYAYRVTFSS